MKKAGIKTQKRRRKENKTDYLNRLKLLKSGKPRIVFRKTNKYIIAQYIVSKKAQDKIEFGTNSKILLKYGWPKENLSGLKSVPASYLLGFLIGKKILKKNLEKPVADFGMIRILHKNRVYAFLKGLIDAGVEIQCKKEFFPNEDRIKGEHLKNKIKLNEIKSKIESEK